MATFKLNILLILLVIAINNTNQFYTKKETCVQNSNCFLPDCLCDSIQVPINTSQTQQRLDEIPQLIVLTFDDESLDLLNYKLYKRLLNAFKNPNGCSLRATFFLSDTYNTTSYCLVRNLYDNLHEIAVSTLKYECPHVYCSRDRKQFQAWSFKNWTQQILDMRHRLEKYASIPKSHLNGFRAPQMEPTSNLHYRIIKAHKFVYDSSLIMNNVKDDNGNGGHILWPFTLDYRIRHPLSNNGPTESFNGLWELPTNNYLDKDGNACLKLWEGHCKYEKTPEGLAKFLRYNFLRSYFNNRAPFVLNLLTSWLKQETRFKQKLYNGPTRLNKTYEFDRILYNNLNGLLLFINETLNHHKNVYFVTAQESIEYIQQLPLLIRKDKTSLNYTQLLDDILNRNNQCSSTMWPNYDGNCLALKQSEPDYDKRKLLKMSVDDLDGENSLKNGVLIDRETLAYLQSESLFINNIIAFLILALILCFLAILIYDKTKKLN